MSEEKQGFLGQVTGVLYRPRHILNNVEERDLSKAIIIILLMVALAGYSSMVYMSKIPYSLLIPQLDNVDISQIGGSIGFFTGIGTGITVFIGWIASTLLLHGIGKFIGGVGSMKRFFAMHGFVSVPSLMNQILRVVDASILDSSSLAGYYLSYRNIENKLLKALIGTNIVNIWGLATLILLVIAIEENYGASRNKAFAVALVPTVIYFAFNYFTA